MHTICQGGLSGSQPQRKRIRRLRRGPFEHLDDAALGVAVANTEPVPDRQTRRLFTVH